MKFLSYAQNCEDVMLWRALGHVQQGFYMDLGAWSPDHDSVTRAFYDRGWNGINVEPNDALWESLEQRRTRDMNLRVAVAGEAGTVWMNFVENSGLSTLDDDLALAHQRAGWASRRKAVRAVRLEDIFQEHVPAGQPVHFLKIDVEGSEGEIIQGFPWSVYRPWVLVIEATKPMSQEASYAEWEPVLLASDYVFVYSDGLNRFYVAQEHIELAVKFQAPPNYFDDFELAEHAQTRESLERLAARQAQTEQELAQARQHIAALTTAGDEHTRKQLELERLRQTLLDRVQALESSVSWRITAPLRQVATRLKVCAGVAHGPLRRLASWGLQHTRLVQAVHAVLRLVPPLHRAAMWGVDMLVMGRPRSDHKLPVLAASKPWLLLERPQDSKGLTTELTVPPLDQVLSEVVRVGQSRWSTGYLLPDEDCYRAVDTLSEALDVGSLHARDTILLLLTEAGIEPGQLEQVQALKARGVWVSVWVVVPTLTTWADRDGALPAWTRALLGSANALVCSSAVSGEWRRVADATSARTASPEVHLLDVPTGLTADATLARVVSQIINSLRPVLQEYLVGIQRAEPDLTTVDDALARIRQELRVFHQA